MPAAKQGGQPGAAGQAESRRDLERDAPPAPAEGAGASGLEGLLLAAGERGAMQARWAPSSGPPPVLWRASGGPRWCSLLNATGGTVACAPPHGTPPGDYALNLTAVLLDAVAGLTQRAFSGTVTVVG